MAHMLELSEVKLKLINMLKALMESIAYKQIRWVILERLEMLRNRQLKILEKKNMLTEIIMSLMAQQ